MVDKGPMTDEANTVTKEKKTLSTELLDEFEKYIGTVGEDNSAHSI